MAANVSDRFVNILAPFLEKYKDLETLRQHLKVDDEFLTNGLRYQVHYDSNRGEWWVYLQIGGNTIVRFKLTQYPSCCAMTVFHEFAAASYASSELIHNFLDHVFKHAFGIWFNSRRLVANFVEYRSRVLVGKDALDEGVFSYDPVEKPNMSYSVFYEYFKKQKYFKTLNIMPNANSGKLVHHIETILN